MNDTKAKISREQNKAKIEKESVYSIWSDDDGSIELKITPYGNHTNIKLMNVKDESIIGKVSEFCGLTMPPRRKNWKGFDLITHLVKRGKFDFRRGVVHMPKAARYTYVDLVGANNKRLVLDFYFFEEENNTDIQKHIGSLLLRKVG